MLEYNYKTKTKNMNPVRENKILNICIIQSLKNNNGNRDYTANLWKRICKNLIISDKGQESLFLIN